MKKSESFILGDLLIERESQFPYFWLVKRDNKVLDKNQYQNDIKECFE